MDIRIRFIPPENNALQAFIASIEDDDPDEALLLPVDEEGKRRYDAILDDYPGYFYQFDGWGWDGDYYELVLSTDDDGRAFAADMIVLLSKNGALNVHAWDESLDNDSPEVLEIRVLDGVVSEKWVSRNNSLNN